MMVSIRDSGKYPNWRMSAAIYDGIKPNIDFLAAGSLSVAWYARKTFRKLGKLYIQLGWV
jgi:hypothetical protein